MIQYRILLYALQFVLAPLPYSRHFPEGHPVYLAYYSSSGTARSRGKRERNETSSGLLWSCSTRQGGMHPSEKQQYVAHSGDFGRLELAPRTSAGTQTSIVLYARASCVPFSRSREKQSPAVGEVLANPQTKYVLHVLHVHVHIQHVTITHSLGRTPKPFSSIAWGGGPRGGTHILIIAHSEFFSDENIVIFT